MKTHKIPGPLAQDKDLARQIRVERVLPAIEAGSELRLDFGDVETATQSFVHALLAEALWRHGERALALVEFFACAPAVQSAIETVVGYCFRARAYSATALPQRTRVSPVEIPQANDLASIRELVQALEHGPITLTEYVELSGVAPRQAWYRASAASTLGLLTMLAGLAFPSESARKLMQLEPLSDAEQQFFRSAIGSSAVIRQVAPTLLDRTPPTAAQLAKSIEKHAALAPATARRRAACLLSWRRQVMTKQLGLGIA